MTERRDLFKNVSAICGGGTNPAKFREIDFKVNRGFPHVEADMHTGERVRFYEDRIKNKIFLVNFMSIQDEQNFPVTRNLSKVVEQLGDKVGREVFVTSITLDPENDTLERLAEFARKHNAPSGWCFLRASAEDAGGLLQKMYHFGKNIGPQLGRIVFYGNGQANVWGSFPALIRPADAANRVTWVMPKEKPAVPRMAGPARLGENPYPWNNRAV